MNDIRITALNVYPVKSCRGVPVARARVDVEGLGIDGELGPGDREFMIVDAAGRFVTQREHPRLALIRVDIAGDHLVLARPDGRKLSVPLAPPPATAPARDVVVWRDTVRASDAGDAAAAFLTAAIGTAVRLVRFDRGGKRHCNAEFAGDSGAHTRFSDGYPVLVLGESTLDELNRRLAGKGSPVLPMNRFRPNLVIAVPNVNFSKGNFTGYNFQIRGIGSKLVAGSGDAGTGIHLNNAPLLSNNLFETEFYDVERVEVLRGPQGTL